MKLKLNKSIVENKNLSNNAILSYVGLLSCPRFNYEPIYINRNMISYYLTGITTNSRRFDEAIKLGLKELIDNGIVDCYNNSSMNYYIGFKNIKLKENDKFIFIDFDEVRTIMKTNYQGKFGLLRYYIVLLGTFISRNHITNIRDTTKYNNVIGMMSQEYMSGLANISTHTAVEYTRILENLNLIYVSHCLFAFKDKKGNVKRHNNIYGRHKDKDIIDEFTKVRYEMYDDLHKVHLSSTANNSRSLMQKYNQMLKGKVYDKKVMDDIYNYVSQYNIKHPKNKRDMDVFEKYGYETNE